MTKRLLFALAAALVVGGTASSQSTFVVAGPDASLMPSDAAGAWDGARLAPLRAALEDDANFSPTGISPITIDTKELSTVDATTLAGVDCFVSPAWPDADLGAAEIDALVHWFLCGGHLILIDPDGSSDAIADRLDLRTFNSTGTDSTGLAPLFDGLFGSSATISHGNGGAPSGRLREPRVRSTRGHVAAVNASGQVTAAYWNPRAYGANSGFLLIVTDRSILSDLGASYAPLNDNGRFVLNAFSLLAERESVYVLGGPSAAQQPSSAAARQWDGGVEIGAFRAALEDHDNFGEYGTVAQRIITEDLDGFDANTLKCLDGFVCPAWAEADVPAGAADALFDFFHDGGDLLQLNDSATEDPMGDRLGIPVSGASAGSDSTGGVPLFDGAFGGASDVSQVGAAGQLSAATVSSLGGTVGATNGSGEVTAAFWAENDFAPGAGNMVILTDLDTASSVGASYDPLDDNGRFCLNAAAFLSTYRTLKVAGPNGALQTASGFFAWQSGAAMISLRNALENPDLFAIDAPGGNGVSTHAIGNIDLPTLARHDVFVAILWADGEISASALQAVLDYNACGGHLLLSSSTTAADDIHASFGVPLVGGTSVIINGTGPLFDGPFGEANDVVRQDASQMRFADVNQANGTAVGFGGVTEVAVATWRPGQFAPGSGRIIACSDHAMSSGFFAEYTPLNDNGTMMLNGFAFLLAPNPEPAVHYGHGCPGSGDLSPTLRLNGNPDIGHTIELSIANGLGNSLAFLWTGVEGRGSANYNGCPFLVGGNPLRLKFGLGGAAGVPGDGSLVISGGIPDNSNLIGLSLNFQAFVRDAGVAAGVSATDGLEFFIGGE